MSSIAKCVALLFFLLNASELLPALARTESNNLSLERTNERKLQQDITFFERGNSIKLEPGSTDHVFDPCTFKNGGAASLSLSENGKVLAVGYKLYGDHRCYYTSSAVSVYMYHDSNKVWELYGSPLLGEGYVTALSSDGKVLAVSEWLAEETVRIYKFDRILASWIMSGSIVNELDGTDDDLYFGHDIAISGNGKIVAVGHPGKFFNDNYYGYDDIAEDSPGITYIYKDQGDGTWIELGDPIVDEVGAMSGTIVTLSTDGKVVATVSYWFEYVKVYQFDESTMVWSQLGSLVTSTRTGMGNDRVNSVALSEDGMRMVVNFGSGNETYERIFVHDQDTGSWILSPVGENEIIFEATGTIVSSTMPSGSKVTFPHSGKVAVSSDGSTVAITGNTSVSVFSTVAPAPTAAPTIITAAPTTTGKGKGKKNKGKGKKSKSKGKGKGGKKDKESKSRKKKDKKSKKYSSGCVDDRSYQFSTMNGMRKCPYILKNEKRRQKFCSKYENGVVIGDKCKAACREC